MREVKASNTPSEGESVCFYHEGEMKGVTGDGIHSCVELLDKPAPKKAPAKRTRGAKARAKKSKK